MVREMERTAIIGTQGLKCAVAAQDRDIVKRNARLMRVNPLTIDVPPGIGIHNCLLLLCTGLCIVSIAREKEFWQVARRVCVFFISGDEYTGRRDRSIPCKQAEGFLCGHMHNACFGNAHVFFWKRKEFTKMQRYDRMHSSEVGRELMEEELATIYGG